MKSKLDPFGIIPISDLRDFEKNIREDEIVELMNHIANTLPAYSSHLAAKKRLETLIEVK